MNWGSREGLQGSETSQYDTVTVGTRPWAVTQTHRMQTTKGAPCGQLRVTRMRPCRLSPRQQMCRRGALGGREAVPVWGRRVSRDALSSALNLKRLQKVKSMKIK